MDVCLDHAGCFEIGASPDKAERFLLHKTVSSGSLPLYSVSPCGLQAEISDHDSSGVLNCWEQYCTVPSQPGVHVDDQPLSANLCLAGVKDLAG